MSRFLLTFPFLLLASAAFAQAAAPTALSCDGPFARDSDHARLVKVFGAANVVFTKIPGPEGSSANGSVVYGKDPKRKFFVTWDNEKARKGPNVTISDAKSTWKTTDGIGIGTSLVDIEQRNGKPFKLSGFDWDYGGFANDFGGGALAKREGGCRLGLRFYPDPKVSNAVSLKVAGDKTFSSNDPNMRAARPAVTEISIMWPR
jgi:hypothetical protein